MFQRLLGHVARRTMACRLQPLTKETSRGMSTMDAAEEKALKRNCILIGVALFVISSTGVVFYWNMKGFNSSVQMKMPSSVMIGTIGSKTEDDDE